MAAWCSGREPISFLVATPLVWLFQSRWSAWQLWFTSFLAYVVCAFLFSTFLVRFAIIPRSCMFTSAVACQAPGSHAIVARYGGGGAIDVAVQATEENSLGMGSLSV